MKVLSIDLAYRDYRDIGVAALHRSDGVIRVEFLPMQRQGRPTPKETAETILELATEHDCQLLLLDGPQAWKAPDTPYPHSRVCERVLNTPAKTGLLGQVKPANYAPFVSFSISVFDELEDRGWPRVPTETGPFGHLAVESFPLSAWRSLGMAILPAKAKAKASDISLRADVLTSQFNLSLPRVPNHDELQALVSGLAGIPMLEGDRAAYKLDGIAPLVIEGVVREGFIANPLRSTSLSIPTIDAPDQWSI